MYHVNKKHTLLDKFPLLQIANVLQAQGKKVFGWDTEWEINWDTKRFKYSGKDLFFR